MRLSLPEGAQETRPVWTMTRLLLLSGGISGIFAFRRIARNYDSVSSTTVSFFRLLPQCPRHLASGQRSGIFRRRGVRTPYLEHQKRMLYHSANHTWNGFCLCFYKLFSSLRWRNLILLAFSISIRITQLKKHGTWLCDKVSRWLKSEVVWR